MSTSGFPLFLLMHSAPLTTLGWDITVQWIFILLMDILFFLVAEKMQLTSVMAQILMHWDEVTNLLKRLSQRGISGREVIFKGMLAGSHNRQ